MTIGNATPQFTKNGVINSTLIYDNNSKTDGSGVINTNIYVAFTANATYGSYVDYIRLIPVAITENSPTTTTVVCIFISSITSGATSSANTYLVAEINLPSQVACSSTAPTVYTDVPCGFRLPPGYTILVTAHHEPNDYYWRALVFGGDY